ncbi:MAG: hypothetical protein KME40_23825 [Komarekiella atlantica HA4396-MV6]|nr:hypothetical protein [Komarekiella atlantica HA4396-MV6]
MNTDEHSEKFCRRVSRRRKLFKTAKNLRVRVTGAQNFSRQINYRCLSVYPAGSPSGSAVAWLSGNPPAALPHRCASISVVVNKKLGFLQD